MRTNFPGIKEKLASGQIALGCLVAYDAPWLVEILGLSGFDFVVIDIEHEPFDDSQVANLIRTADAYSLPSIVRTTLFRAGHPVVGRRRSWREGSQSERQGSRRGTCRDD